MRHTSSTKTLPLALLVALTTLSGCGGAGTAPGGLSTANSSTARGEEGGAGGKTAVGRPAAGDGGRLGVFVTASGASKVYDRLWVTLLRIELVDDKEKAVTIFDSVEGRTLNLGSLTDAGGKGRSQRYALVALGQAPQGHAYSRVRVTFDKAMQLAGKDQGAEQAVTPLSDTLARDAEGRPVLSFPLLRPRDLGAGKEDLVIDFDLARLAVAEGRVAPALREGTIAGLVAEPASQEPTDFTGVISEISGGAPQNTLTLTLPTGGTLTVQTAAVTALYNATTQPAPALEKGKTVRVRGTLATDGSHRLVAREVVVYPEGETGKAAATPRISGVASGARKEAGTFALAAEQVSGLMPAQGAVTVLLAPDAALRSRGGLLLGADEFWEALAAKSATTRVRVEGEWEPVTGTLRARAAKLVDDSAPSHEVEIEGAPATIDGDAGTLSVEKWNHWDGLAAPGEGKGLTVVTTAATAFRDEKGAFLASTSFFQQAKEGGHAVRVQGIYAPDGSLTATRLDLRPPAPQAKTDTAAEGKGKPSVEGQTAASPPTPGEKPTGEAAAKVKGDAPAPASDSKAEEKKPEAPRPEEPKTAEEGTPS